MCESFSKKEPTQNLQSEQWAEFEEKQRHDTREMLKRTIADMKPDDFKSPSSEERRRGELNQKRVEEDMAEFIRKKEYWSSKLREKEKELGFAPTEWWQERFNFYIPREVVDPEHKIKNGRDVLKQIGRWLHQNGFAPKDVVVSTDAREYPEVVDRDIRDLVARLNDLPFIKTTNSCAGHGAGDRESVARGYDAAELTFVINRNIPGGEAFLKAFQQNTQAFNEPLSAVSIEKYADHGDGITEYRAEFYPRSPSQEWLDMHQKPYLTYTKAESPERQEEIKQLFREVLKEEGKPAHDRAVERLAYGYFDRFEKTYKGYPTSREAKKRTDEFWQNVERLVDRFLELV